MEDAPSRSHGYMVIRAIAPGSVNGTTLSSFGRCVSHAHRVLIGAIMPFCTGLNAGVDAGVISGASAGADGGVVVGSLVIPTLKIRAA